MKVLLCFIYVCKHGEMCVSELVVFIWFRMRGKHPIMLTQLTLFTNLVYCYWHNVS